jgi:hypothetical protein
MDARPLYEPPLWTRSTIDRRHLIEQKAEESALLRFARALQEEGQKFVDSPAGGLLIAGAVTVAEVAVDVGMGLLEDATGQDSFVSPRSSAIAGAVYDAKFMTVEIQFKGGGMYSYPCDPATWKAFKAAPSKGKFYNDHFAE